MKQKLHAARIGLVRAYARTRTRQTEIKWHALIDVEEPENARMYARRQLRILDVWCGVLDFGVAVFDIALGILNIGKDR
jgi:hypothetical protein